MIIIVRVLVALTVLATLLFGAAGRWDLPFFWVYLGLGAGFAVAFLLVTDPGLQQERIGRGSSRQGRGFRLLLAPFVLTTLLVAGLDAGRFHWSGPMPVGVQIAGLAGCALALGLVLWAMAVNRFFSPAVRIQRERGHHLITAGPYRYVRHPGYLGMVLLPACSALALGSWWALLPAAGYAALIVGRTATEDRFLRAELAGYADYAKQVRYRLVPGVW